MPFARKRRTRRKAPRKTRTRVMRSIARKEISRLAEKKYWLTADDSATPSYTGSMVDLSAVPQGDNDSSRDGDSLAIRSTRMKGHIIAADTTNVVRLILFHWLDDSTPTISNVLSGNYTSGSVNVVDAPYTHDQRRKIRVLWDRTFNLHSGQDQVVFDTRYLKPKQKKIAYTAAGTTGYNKIWMLMVSDSAAVAHPSVAYVNRLTFNDM